jgi:2'-5' RNA ligase
MSEQKLIRSFIAVNLPSELKEAIYNEAAPLRATGADVKWIEARNLHITLKFLGYVPETDIEKIEKIASEVVKSSTPFELELIGIGSFPEGKRAPRVIWVGVKESPGGVLQKIQQELEDSLKELGFEPEGRFSPHLTLGRVKSNKNTPSLLRAITTLSGSRFGKIKVEKIDLMKSDLKPSGAEYSIIKEIRFGQ